MLAQYDVKSVPTLILLLGDEVLGKIVGVKPEADLRNWLSIHMIHIQYLEVLKEEESHG